MLGTELTNLLSNEDCMALSSVECDVTKIEELKDKIKKAQYIVNCAAYTAVDEAEINENHAFEVNATGAKNTSLLAESLNAKLIYISTDYVFPGDNLSPYAEDAATGPKSAYGRTKLAGEVAVKEIYSQNSFIVRTAWLYGEHGPNFVKTMINLERQKETISVVDDQIGQPTWTLDLGKKVVELAKSSAAPGIYHGTSSGETSWFNFAKRIFEHIGADRNRVLPISSEEFVRPAPRPAYSVLGHEKWKQANLEPIRDWESALTSAFESGAFNNA